MDIFEDYISYHTIRLLSFLWKAVNRRNGIDDLIDGISSTSSSGVVGKVWGRITQCKCSNQHTEKHLPPKKYISAKQSNIAWNSCATHMHHTSDTLYFKEYNLVIKATFSVHKITTKNTQMPTLHVYTN